MFLLIILFGLAAFGLVFALYMQADLPAASHAQMNPPVAVGKAAIPSPAPQPDSAALAPTAGTNANTDAGPDATASAAAPVPAPSANPSSADID